MTQTVNLTRTAATSSVLMQSIFMALIGATLVFAAGFAHSQSLHDAAHDLRHSNGFPCH